MLLLGSHMIDYYPIVFIILGLFFIDWKKVKRVETFLVAALYLSLYIIWYLIDKDILHHSKYMGQGILFVVMFMVGLSITTIEKNSFFTKEKTLFYLLYIFFVGYMLSILYSYFFIVQDKSLTSYGMHVCFLNEYKRLNVNHGNLISTIITYYLSAIIAPLPLILFYWKEFTKKGFLKIELLLFIFFAIFSFYTAMQMGRRTAILLFAIALLYILFFKSIELLKTKNFKKLIYLSLILIVLLGIGYYFFADNHTIQRIGYLFHDKRFGYWSKGIDAMLKYPFGGGYDVVILHKTKLAHNLWADFGKDFGIIPFVLMIIITIFYLYHLISIFINKDISILIKHMIALFSIVFFSIMMVEPIFNSDKTYFIYFMYLFGVIIAINRDNNIIDSVK